jgi:2-dehydropantoate 2-reductase
MNILVYGAGVLGSLFAARLQAAGHHVTLLARGQRLADLRTHGVVLEHATSKVRTTYPVDVTDTLAPDAIYDLILVIMRKNQVPTIIPHLAKNNTPDVLLLTNNAAGPDAYIEALGRDRVLMGFPGAGGAREGHVIRYTMAEGSLGGTIIGELDGSASPRVQGIANALEQAGFAPTISPNIDAWLKTHAIVVTPIANAIYAAGGDIQRLARTRDALALIVRAMREGFRVLDSLGTPVTPGGLRLIDWLPEPLLVALLSRIFRNPEAELKLASHANAARDEMTTLTREIKQLKRQARVDTPAIDRLALYLSEDMPPMPEGEAVLPLDWQSLWAAVIVLLAGSHVIAYLLGRLRGDNR